MLSYLYELPFGPRKPFLAKAAGFLGKLAGGWQVNGINTFSSGFPFTVSAAPVHGTGAGVPQRANRLGDGRLPKSQRTVERYFDTSAFAQPPTGAQGNSGRNVLVGPGVNNWDFSIVKNNRISDKVMLQFRAEFFNLFNHPQFAQPVADVSSGAFGQIERAADGRDIQFGVKLIW
ncbi:MAG: hypothetical protein L0387_43110 [Acidobacteria bacterium]|nr:hypothetical protein [Acidobacteriota bacterium]